MTSGYQVEVFEKKGYGPPTNSVLLIKLRDIEYWLQNYDP